MQEKLRTEADGYVTRKHRRQIWKRVVGLLACIVVFCTTYALILPAITMEHTGELTCSLQTLGIHTHSADCFDDEGKVACGYADFVVHTHDANCYDQDGALICPLPEIQAHTHTSACYGSAQETAVTETHVHTTEPGRLICQQEESEGHQHNETCYESQQVPTEPAGSTESAEPELICGKAEIILHEHGPDCLDEDGNRICGKTQVLEHVHASDCFQPVAPAETDAFTEGEQARIDELIAAIDGLPTQEEIEAALNAYEEAGDEDGYEAYFEELYHGVMPIYVNYQALAPEQQELVTNREKLLELAPNIRLIKDQNTQDDLLSGEVGAAVLYTSQATMAKMANPDLEVVFEPPRTDDKDNPRFLLREQDLNRHLENGKDKKGGQSKVKKDEGKEQLARDNQLRMALQVVKSLPKMREIRN